MEVDPKRRVAAFPMVGNIWEDSARVPGMAKARSKHHFDFACPGCGETRSIPIGAPGWDLVEGKLDDLASISLKPSILCKSCCGWHGYLTKGVFEPC